MMLMHLVSQKQAAHKPQRILPPIGLENFVKSTLQPVSFNSSKLTARAQLWLEINYITQRSQFMIGSHGNAKQ